MSTDKSDKLKKMDKLVDLINKRNQRRGSGEPVIVKGSQMRVPGRIPSGILSLDHHLGGGFPRSLYSMLWGPPGCGKTSLLLKTVANAQRVDPNLVTIFLDGSKRFGSMIGYAQNLGVDMDRFFPVETETVEEAVQIAVEAAKESIVDFIVCDDLAVYTSVKELRKGGIEKDYREITDEAMATQAAANGKFIRRTNGLFYQRDVACIFTQQVRANFDQYGGDFHLPGGHALQHVLAINLLITQAATSHFPTVDSTIDGDRCGYAVRVSTTKMALDEAMPTGSQFVTQWLTGKGIEPGRDAFMFLNDKGLIETGGRVRKFSSRLRDILTEADPPESFPSRRECETWLRENFDLVYQNFVPNLELQMRDQHSRLTYEEFTKIRSKAKGEEEQWQANASAS